MKITNGLADKTRALLPGISISLVIAFAAMFLGEHYGAPTMLFAVLLGMALNFLGDEPRSRAGIAFTSKSLLKVGVALLGFRLALSDFAALGLDAVGWLALAVGSTILIGAAIAFRSAFKARFGILTGGAVAICGASAALALSTVLPRGERSEQLTALAVIGVTSMSTVAMIAYPVLAQNMGWDDAAAGLFFGATIHDVAQVAGAGFSVSNEAGNTAVMVKLIRVAMLFPVVVTVGAIYRRQLAVPAADGAAAERVPVVPLFLVFFIVFVGLNSTGLVPAQFIDGASLASRWLLTAGVAAIGLRSKLGEILELGAFPLWLIVAETLWIGSLIGLALHFSQII